MRKAFYCIFLMLPSMNALAQSKYIQAVDEYMPAPGQFVNTMPEATPDDTPATMAQKCTERLADNANQLVTLGAWGGYITFHFDHPVANIPGQPDLYIKGNANVNGAEPGIVMVSQDANGNGLPDDPWYELAGSADVDSAGLVTYGYLLTYTRQGDLQDVPWADSQGGSGSVVRNGFHKQEYFPLWLGDELTLQGTLLPTNALNRKPGGNDWVLKALRYGYVDNQPNTDSLANSFNLDWAVDPLTRQPAKLTHADFIRIYTAQNQVCGWLGETSTEITGAEDLHLEASLQQAAGIDDLRIDREDEVQIVNGKFENRECFDLQGRQVARRQFTNRSSIRGLRIIDGKKYVYQPF